MYTAYQNTLKLYLPLPDYPLKERKTNKALLQPVSTDFIHDNITEKGKEQSLN